MRVIIVASKCQYALNCYFLMNLRMFSGKVLHGSIEPYIVLCCTHVTLLGTWDYCASQTENHSVVGIVFDHASVIFTWEVNRVPRYPRTWSVWFYKKPRARDFPGIPVMWNVDIVPSELQVGQRMEVFWGSGSLFWFDTTAGLGFWIRRLEILPFNILLPVRSTLCSFCPLP